MTGEELLAVCARIRSYHEQGPVGALAIVCTPEQTVEFARLLGTLASADRSIKMFPSLRQAHTWLGHQRKLMPVGRCGMLPVVGVQLAVILLSNGWSIKTNWRERSETLPAVHAGWRNRNCATPTKPC